MSTYIMDFLKYYEIDERTREVTLDLIDDIWARCDLTASPMDVNEIGDVALAIEVRGTRGGYMIRGSAGGLPDDHGLVLMHGDELLMDIVSNGSLIQNARASNGVCIEINARQKLLETKVAI